VKFTSFIGLQENKRRQKEGIFIAD